MYERLTTGVVLSDRTLQFNVLFVCKIVHFNFMLLFSDSETFQNYQSRLKLRLMHEVGLKRLKPHNPGDNKEMDES